MICFSYNIHLRVYSVPTAFRIFIRRVQMYGDKCFLSWRTLSLVMRRSTKRALCFGYAQQRTTARTYSSVVVVDTAVVVDMFGIRLNVGDYNR